MLLPGKYALFGDRLMFFEVYADLNETIKTKLSNL